MTPHEVVARAATQCVGPDARKHPWGEMADAILAALRDAGFAVVPREGLRAIVFPGQRRPVVPDGSTHETAIEWARAMLAAAEGDTP